MRGGSARACRPSIYLDTKMSVVDAQNGVHLRISFLPKRPERRRETERPMAGEWREGTRNGLADLNDGALRASAMRWAQHFAGFVCLRRLYTPTLRGSTTPVRGRRPARSSTPSDSSATTQLPTGRQSSRNIHPLAAMYNSVTVT